MPPKVRKNRLGTLSLVGVTVGLILVAVVFRGYLASVWLWRFNLQSLLEAAFEAAFVGGCADWFAVVALFRHPFGIPIPHTRILPRKQEEIAEGVKDMVGKFLTPASIGEMVQNKNLALLMFSFFDHGKESGVFKDLLTRLSPIVIQELRSRAILGPIVTPIARYFETHVDYAKVTATVLGFLKIKELDDKIMDFMSAQAINVIEQEKSFLAKKLIAFVATLEGDGAVGKVKMWFVKRFIDQNEVESFIEKIRPSLQAEVSESGGQTFKQTLRRMLNDYTYALQHDQEVQAVVNTQMRQILRNLNIDESLRIVNSWTADYLEGELAKGEGSCFQLLRELGASILTEIRGNARVIAEIDVMMKRVIAIVINSGALVSNLGHIAGQEVRRMSEGNLVDFIEEKVGYDLQHIRVNGTIIGGLVGVILYFLKVMVLA